MSEIRFEDVYGTSCGVELLDYDNEGKIEIGHDYDGNEQGFREIVLSRETARAFAKAILSLIGDDE